MLPIFLAMALLLTSCGPGVSIPASPDETPATVQDETADTGASPEAVPTDESASPEPAPTDASASPSPAPTEVSASPTPVPVASPQPTIGAPGPPQPAFTLMNADDGKTFHLKVGQLIYLALQANQGMDNWVVQNPDPAILTPAVNPGAAAVRGATLRAFAAAAPGTATISATDKATCPPGQACPQFVVAWKVTVVVDPN